MSKWEIVIGLETHAQLSTKSKMFSGASTAFGAAPNTQACAVDLALPGVLPVANVGAVERAIRFGLAVGATINTTSIFARKNYFYPDLPKGYQISQYEVPVVQGGSLTITTSAGQKTVRLTRAHLEEDAGKSLHEDFHGMTGIDLNRAGTPLLEIVTEPDMASAEEAVVYAKALHALVRWIGICDGNMQEGSFRCDANVSVRRSGEPLGTRCEIKNLNSFRFMEKAIEFEVHRQIELIEDGGKVVQETRLFDPDIGETRSMRSKEDAHDYRYFPDPDLPPLMIGDDWIARVQREMPELPAAMAARFIADYVLPAYDAEQLTASLAFARYFETATNIVGKANAKIVANWMLGELSAALNRHEIDIENAPISPQQLAALVTRVQDGTLSNKGGKEVFEALWQSGKDSKNDIDAVIAERSLQQISDEAALEKMVDDVLAQNPAIVAEVRAGKEKAFNSLVGQIMKASRGKANPSQVNVLLKKKL
ncbi:MAG: Asp-tRNA(Asn)/Glu-tRNA(Gln) amidotransferase subunit GatB [Burkholderiales bacterium]|jgi:aspartyl-tRNA(Asn)/glutamyl-tRNA(Gln) amidotransferase subunit B|nr:Asp-tRNA(Asn)/Glu-tRNA(Gln) amidotransferase subunit GatB [Burkholderiales bacterium]